MTRISHSKWQKNKWPATFLYGLLWWQRHILYHPTETLKPWSLSILVKTMLCYLLLDSWRWHSNLCGHTLEDLLEESDDNRPQQMILAHHYVAEYQITAKCLKHHYASEMIKSCQRRETENLAGCFKQSKLQVQTFKLHVQIKAQWVRLQNSQIPLHIKYRLNCISQSVVILNQCSYMWINPNNEQYYLESYNSQCDQHAPTRI